MKSQKSMQDDLAAELATVSSELRALAARVTALKGRVNYTRKPPPKSWLQMETELVRLRARVIAMLREENWTYRRIADVVGITPANVHQYVGRAERKQRMAVVRTARAAKLAAMSPEKRAVLLAQSPRELRVGVWTGSALERFGSLGALCDCTEAELAQKIGKNRVRDVCEALAEHGLCLKSDTEEKR